MTTNFYSIVKLGIYIIVLIPTFQSCKSSQIVSSSTKPAGDIEHVVFDTMVINGNDPKFQEEDKEPSPQKYNPSATRTFDLLHTKLAVSFDWAKQHLIGNAELTLTPYFYAQSILTLDAKGFQINSIKNKQSGLDLKYKYDGMLLSIDLNKTYQKGEEFIVAIDYIAKPNEGVEGGSAAIKSDKGLFFINPLNKEKGKPQQIWTQGETESNSRWFPTIDKPNERCTQEIAITVDEKFTTLSNGTMVSSIKVGNGKRTDTWKMDKPHAPYLFMMAVGEFAWIKDQWKNIPLYYIVEPEYKDYAAQIFNNTPEMLEFFSKKFDYPFPWDKYAQIIVRDYISGAMENTTASLFGQFIQKTDRELVDDDNDAIVAHELMHQWFGDLVTIESWANLTLNEGFANYAEYLWLEHKYGNNRADMHRLNELQEYMAASAQNTHPLINYGYDDKEDMFDAHSYNKGGLVLHMLRAYVGDDAFFASLAHYLKKNQFSSVEVDDLRQAFEDVTGEDLHWFFNQWFLTEGHPDIKVSYQYNPKEKELRAFINQEQYPNYKIPFDMAVYNKDGQITYHRVWAMNQFDTIVIKDVAEKPSNVSLDGKDDILAVIKEDKEISNYISELMYSPNPAQRYAAINALSIRDSVDYEQLTTIGLLDDNYLTQVAALENMSDVTKYIARLKNLAVNGSHTELRSLALQKLYESEEDITETVLQVLEKDRSNNVITMALSILAELDPEKAMVQAEKFEKLNSEPLLPGIAAVRSKSTDARAGNWFIEKINSSSSYNAYQLFSPLVEFLLHLKPEEIKPYVSQLFDIGVDMEKNNFIRYISIESLAVIKAQLSTVPDAETTSLVTELETYITKAKSIEKDPLLLSRYTDF